MWWVFLGQSRTQDSDRTIEVHQDRKAWLSFVGGIRLCDAVGLEPICYAEAVLALLGLASESLVKDMPVRHRASQAHRFLLRLTGQKGDRPGCLYYSRRDRGFEVFDVQLVGHLVETMAVLS